MRFYYRIFFLLFFAFADAAIAQQTTDSVNVLPQINISALRLNQANETSIVQVLDTSFTKFSTPSVADQLTREGGLFIKSYGPGSLSTLSLRGSNASQTAVLWNGINICSPMLGLFDLTLIPTFLIDQATIQYGGSGASLGSGAIGGALHLDSKTKKEKGLEIDVLASGGSFGFYEGGLGVSNYNGKVYTNTRLFSQGALNNFKFKNYKEEIIVQPNAKFNQIGFAQDLTIGKENNLVSIHAWYLKNEREIPPHMLTTSSKQKQEDEALRLTGEWKLNLGFWNMNFHTGWNKENLNYRDPSSKIEDLSTSYSFQNEAEVSYQKIKNLTLSAQIYWLHNEAVESFYGSRQKVEQTGLTFSANYHINKFSIHADVKQGLHNGNNLPILPSISTTWNLYKSLLLKSSVTVLYRVPTLNDLFWKPGGNINLKPERGITESLFIGWSKSRNENLVSLEAGVFNTRTKDEIVWIPGSNGIYQAENINEIWSRGFEGSIKGNYHVNKLAINGFITSHYTLSTITKTALILKEATGNQLSYTPIILMKANIGFRYSAWSLNYFHEVTDERFTSLENDQKLKAYQIGEFNLAYESTIHKSIIHIFLSIKNCWDINYQVIAYRAMPGRSFQTGIVLKIK